MILIPFTLPQISSFALSLKCFSSDSDSCPAVGIGPLLQFPHPLRAVPVLLTLLFFCLVPSSYWVLHGSIYSFPLVRCFCPFSAGVLHVFLCLKVYSWCIHGERCIPCPPAPPPPSGFKKICPLKSSAHFSSFSRIRFDHFFQVQAKFYCSRLNKPSAFWDSFRLEG